MTVARHEAHCPCCQPEGQGFTVQPLAHLVGRADLRGGRRLSNGSIAGRGQPTAVVSGRDGRPIFATRPLGGASAQGGRHTNLVWPCGEEPIGAQQECATNVL